MSDCISRQMAIEAINEDKIDLTNTNVVAVFKATGDFEKVETQVMTCDRHIKILKDLPFAQPAGLERPSARWMSVGHKSARICSRCFRDEPYKFADYDADVYDFCPYCGAKMEVSK